MHEDQGRGPGASRRAMLGMTIGGSAAAAMLPAGVAAAATAPASAPAPAGLLVATDPSDVVEIRSGKLRGYRRGGVQIFKGIPYAGDTGGKARFLPPAPVKPWSETRSSMAFGPTCPQNVRTDWQSDMAAFLFHWDDGYPGEDCLRANVWTPLDRAGRKPMAVMLWLHGGGFTAGSGQELPAYDGEQLARNHGVVVVTVNHRLGPLGYLDLSEVGGADYAKSGNAGMLDLVAALEWVRDNIAAFGGDPHNVTIFGQSGGGAKVATLMGMPAARGLFHKAIIQSGSGVLDSDRSGPLRLASALVDELGDGGIARLQSADPQAIIAAGQRAMRKLAPPPAPMKMGAAFPRRVGWGPVVDGAVLPEAPFGKAAPAISADVPLMVGTTRDEFGGVREPGFTEDKLLAMIAGDAAHQHSVLAAYKAAYPGLAANRLSAVMSSMALRNAALRQATLKAAQGTPAFNYWFTWQCPMVDGALGAFHCLDLAFCFDNVARWDTVTGNSPEARRLGTLMSTAWTNFAKTGNPSQPGFVWPKFDAASVPTAVFDARSQIIRDPVGNARRMLASD